MTIHHRDIAAKESEGVAGGDSVAAVSVVLLRWCCCCACASRHPLAGGRTIATAAARCGSFELQLATCNLQLATCNAVDPDKQTLRASCSCPELSTWTPEPSKAHAQHVAETPLKSG